VSGSSTSMTTVIEGTPRSRVSFDRFVLLLRFGGDACLWGAFEGLGRAGEVIISTISDEESSRSVTSRFWAPLEGALNSTPGSKWAGVGGLRSDSGLLGLCEKNATTF
jgi:hypothetical protein